MTTCIGPRRISEGAWRTLSETACGNVLGTGMAEAHQLTELCRECLATEYGQSMVGSISAAHSHCLMPGSVFLCRVSGSAKAALQRVQLQERMEQVAHLLHETDRRAKDRSSDVFVSSPWLRYCIDG